MGSRTGAAIPTPPGTALRTERISHADALLRRHPRLLARLFTDAEWHYCTTRRLGGQHVAARLAAKRAAMALLGRCRFAELEIVRDERGAPQMQVGGQPGRVHVSLSHDGDLAVALVARADTGAERG